MPTINNKHPNKDFLKILKGKIKLMEDTNRKHPNFFDTEKLKKLAKKLWRIDANSK